MPRRRERRTAARFLMKESSRSSADTDTSSILTFGKRSADDDAWYECEASADKLENSNALEVKEVLRIRYCGAEVSESDIIYTAKEARSRLRPLCEKLQDGACFQMEVGEIVLATRTHEKGPFYEAHLKQVHRQRHSLRAACKCKFGLVWMDKTMKGVEWTAPASKIRKINNRSIEGCQLLLKWPPDTESAPFEVKTPEDDWISMLERELDRVTVIAESLTKTLSKREFIADNIAGTQTNRSNLIERLTNVAVLKLSNLSGTYDCLFGFVNIAADLHGLLEASNSQSDSTFMKLQSKKKKTRGIVRRGSKRGMASCRTSIKKGTHQDLKPRLSPLAACAALASMRPLNFQSPDDKIKLEEPPCMDLKESVSSDHFALGTTALEDNFLPITSVTVNKQKEFLPEPTEHNRPKSPPGLTSSLSLTKSHPTSTNNCSFAVKRTRKVRSIKLVENLPSTEKNVIVAAKRSKRIMNRVCEWQSSMVGNNEANLLLAEKMQRVEKGECQFESARCDLRSEHSSDKRSMKQVCEKENSMNYVKDDQLHVSNLIKQGDIELGDSLKASMEHKDRQRRRCKNAQPLAPKVESFDDGIDVLFESENCNQGNLRLSSKNLQGSSKLVRDAGSGSYIHSLLLSSKQNMLEDLVKNDAQGNVFSAELESDNQLIVQIEIEARDIKTVMKGLHYKKHNAKMGVPKYR